VDDLPYPSPPDQALQAYYGLPSEIAFCRRCVISNQRPNSTVEFLNRPSTAKQVTNFDKEGLCGGCRLAYRKANEIDWAKREQELRELCDRHRRNDGRYDCVIPGSGGKDSGYVSHILKYKYGMNPLTVTWSPHRYTQIGWQNLQSWIHSGFDNYLCTPNGKLHRLLTRLAFENLCHPFQPFIIGQKFVGPRFSSFFDIPLIMYGENPAEYGDTNDPDRPTMDPSFFTVDFDINKYYLGGVSVPDLIKEYGVDIRDLNAYFPPDANRVREVRTEVHYISYYLRWDPQANFYYAVENTGYIPNPQRTQGTYSKYCSIDDVIDHLHYYTTFIKFGMGRATYDAAQEIRTGKITREEGVALVRRYDAEFPSERFAEIVEYMGITEERFWQVINDARSPHLWQKEGGEWKLRHQVS
jgi:N-acetyl sugar amidotransferase